MTGHTENEGQHVPNQTDVVVVGAGPVGLMASLLLSKYHVPHVLVEQRTQPENHPQAHFINRRTMEILREIGFLNQAVRTHSAPVDEWRRFVYCTGLWNLPAPDRIRTGPSGSLLGVVDHFAGIPDDDFSPEQVAHFPQHDFVRLLRSEALKSSFCTALEGYRARIQENPNRLSAVLTECRSGRRRQIETMYVVAADGAHSLIRSDLGIRVVCRAGTLQHIINVHFFSPWLADHLRRRLPAMLYFIYSGTGVGVLVAHSFRRGEFVAQIPFFPPHQRAEDFDVHRCIALLEGLIGKRIRIDIRSIRNWRMATGVAARFRSRNGRCFLVGDAAHQFTPAGGFGMNTGIQDAHNLIWKIALTLRQDPWRQDGAAERLLASYEDERKPVAEQNAKWSVENYMITLRIPRAIGLNLSIANWMNHIMRRLPGANGPKRRLFQAAFRLGLKQVNWLKADDPISRYRQRALNRIFVDANRQTLQLFFPGQDLGFVYERGWVFGKNRTEEAQTNRFVYEPALKLGGRIPHFWLEDKNGQRVSVLDLPKRMMGTNRVPCCVLLRRGKPKRPTLNLDRFAYQVQLDVEILEGKAHGSTDFSLHRIRPAFLPPSFEILLRPDGHIAWL